MFFGEHLAGQPPRCIVKSAHALELTNDFHSEGPIDLARPRMVVDWPGNGDLFGL